MTFLQLWIQQGLGFSLSTGCSEGKVKKALWVIMGIQESPEKSALQANGVGRIDQQASESPQRVCGLYVYSKTVVRCKWHDLLVITSHCWLCIQATHQLLTTLICTSLTFRPSLLFTSFWSLGNFLCLLKVLPLKLCRHAFLSRDNSRCSLLTSLYRSHTLPVLHGCVEQRVHLGGSSREEERSEERDSRDGKARTMGKSQGGLCG